MAIAMMAQPFSYMIYLMNYQTLPLKLLLALALVPGFEYKPIRGLVLLFGV